MEPQNTRNTQMKKLLNLMNTVFGVNLALVIVVECWLCVVTTVPHFWGSMISAFAFLFCGMLYAAWSE